MTPVELLLSKLPNAKRQSQGWVACCPAHEDKRPSLSISEGEGGRALVHCHAGCTPEEIVAALGLKLADLMPEAPTTARPMPRATRKAKAPAARTAATYPTAAEAVAELERQYGPRAAVWTYQSADDGPVGLVVRWDTPTGKKIRPVSKTPAGWIIGGMAESRPLYRLPELLTRPGERVYVVEGEKCAEALARLGLLATTSPHGSKSAGKADWTPLAGREVVILPDADEAGEKYAVDVAAILAKLRPPAGMRVVRLRETWPDLPKGGDMADVVERGEAPDATKAKLAALVDAATPEAPVAPAPAVEPFRPFPTEALPEPIRAYAYSVAGGMDVDPIMVAAPALGVFAGAVGNSVRVTVNHGWTEPCALWLGLIALPGSLKSQTQAAATLPMHDAQRQADAQHEAQAAEYEQALAEWDTARKSHKGKDGVPVPPKPEEPVRRQWLVGDTTPEALAHVLKGNPRGVVALHDELGALFGGFGRYSKNAGGSEPGAAFYKSAYSAVTYTENRKGENGHGRYLRIESPLVSIVGAIQPEAFQRIVTRQYVEDGLASRFNWAWPPDSPGGWVDATAADAMPATNYAEAYARLAAIPLNVGVDGRLNPHYVGLCREAASVARNWVNGHKERIKGASGAAVRAALAKLKGGAFRLALVFHLAD